MDKLWAPWRIKYVSELIGKTKGCVFCRIARSRDDKKNLVFIRRKLCYSVLNLYPYNNGHSLVLPYRHVPDLIDLTTEETHELFDLMNECRGLLDRILRPAGYNVGMNLGREAGAGFPGHLHIHIVPRWKGDVNFMPVVAQTKVISQSLQAFYMQLLRVQRPGKRKTRKKKN